MITNLSAKIDATHTGTNRGAKVDIAASGNGRTTIKIDDQVSVEVATGDLLTLARMLEAVEPTGATQ